VDGLRFGLLWKPGEDLDVPETFIGREGRDFGSNGYLTLTEGTTTHNHQLMLNLIARTTEYLLSVSAIPIGEKVMISIPAFALMSNTVSMMHVDLQTFLLVFWIIQP
jgi:hypothetical protein